MIEQDNDQKLSEETKEETSTKPLSKVQQMGKILDDLCTKKGLTYTKVKPQSCTTMFVKNTL